MSLLSLAGWQMTKVATACDYDSAPRAVLIKLARTCLLAVPGAIDGSRSCYMDTVGARAFRQITGFMAQKLGAFSLSFFSSFSCLPSYYFRRTVFSYRYPFSLLIFLLINLFSLFFFPLSFSPPWCRQGGNGPLGPGQKNRVFVMWGHLANWQFLP